MIEIIYIGSNTDYLFLVSAYIVSQKAASVLYKVQVLLDHEL